MNKPFFKHYWNLLGLFLIGFSFNFSIAQNQVKNDVFPKHNITFKQEGKKIGLPNFLNTITKDRRGFFWISSLDGIYRYDGIHIKAYQHDPTDPKGLSSNEVIALFYDNFDNLWASTADHLFYKYHPHLDKFQQFPIYFNSEKEAIPIKIRALLPDSKGNIWLATEDFGLNLLDPLTGKLTHINLGDFLPHDYPVIYDLLEDSKGNLWGIGWNLFKLTFDKNSHQIKGGTYYSLLAGTHRGKGSLNLIKCILEGKHGEIWAAGLSKEIFQLNPQNREIRRFNFDKEAGKADYLVMDRTNSLTYNLDFNIKDNTFSKIEAHVNELYQTPSGNLWMANNTGGLTLFNPKSAEFTSFQHDVLKPKSLSNNAVSDIYGIGEEIWVTTQGGGLNHLQPNLNDFGHLNKIPSVNHSLSDKVVTTFCQDSQQTIWVGTANGLNKFNAQNQQFTQYFPPTSLTQTQQTQLFSIAIAKNKAPIPKGHFWIGSQAGLLTFNPQNGKFSKWQVAKDSSKSLNLDYVSQLKIDNLGQLWAVAYLPYQLFKWNNDRNIFQPFPIEYDGKTLEYFSKIIADQQNNYWLATEEKELFKLDINAPKVEAVKVLPQAEAFFPVSLIQCFWEDSLGRQWVGTTKGLYLLKPTQNSSEYQFQRFTKLDGLPDISIVGILESKKGVLWLSTHQGLSRFDTKNKTFQNYHQTDGLQDEFFSQNACFKSSSSENLFFGGINGFNYFNPSQLQKDTTAPEVLITELEVLRDSSLRRIMPNLEAPTAKIELFWSDKLLKIQFAALHFAAPEFNQFAVQMESYDQDWRYLGTQSEVTYTNLKSGTYLFRVKAANKDGVWNEKGKSLKIIVHPPFWATWWTYLIYAIILGISIYFLNRFQLKRHEEKQEAARLKELDQLKSRFFINVAHELRTPLTLISGPLQNILKRDDASPRTLTDLMLMKNHTKRLLNLVGEILDLSKMEKGKLTLKETTVEFYSLLRQLIAAFESAANYDNIILQFNYNLTQPLHLQLDISKFEKIINNLLSNALKFTPKGGQITLTASDLGGNIQIEIADTGKGIPTEDLPHIFDRYFQTKKTNEPLEGGTGIGLALCKEYARLFGGDITVASKLGAGSTFTLVFVKKEVMGLPFEVKKEAPIQKTKIKPSLQNEAVLKENSEKMSVLIVEDNSDMRLYIQRILEENFNCKTAQNGQVAWEMLSEKTVQPDLIISDVMMPYMDGFTLLENIKSNDNLRGIPVIMLTARARREDRLRGLTFGIDDYIIKPFDGEELLVRVTNLLENYKARQTPIIQNRKEIEALNPEKMQFEAVTSADLQWMEEIAEHIKSDLNNPELSLLTVAQKMAISERHLRRRIKQITGMNAGNYLKEIRLQRARQLLENKAFQSTSEVSYAVGFNTPKYFSKIFRERFGKMPSEYF